MINHDKENEEKIIKLNVAIIRNGMKRIAEETRTMREALNALEHGFRLDADNEDVMQLVINTATSSRTLSTFVNDLTEKLTTENQKSVGTGHVSQSTYNTGNAK